MQVLVCYAVIEEYCARRMLCSGHLQVMPVIQWDDHPFLNLKPDPEVGPLALALRALLLEDLDPKQDRYAFPCGTSPLQVAVPDCSCSGHQEAISVEREMRLFCGLVSNPS